MTVEAITRMIDFNKWNSLHEPVKRYKLEAPGYEKYGKKLSLPAIVKVAFRDVATPAVLFASHQYTPESCSRLFCNTLIENERKKKKYEPVKKCVTPNVHYFVRLIIKPQITHLHTST